MTPMPAAQMRSNVGPGRRGVGAGDEAGRHVGDAAPGDARADAIAARHPAGGAHGEAQGSRDALVVEVAGDVVAHVLAARAARGRRRRAGRGAPGPRVRRRRGPAAAARRGPDGSGAGGRAPAARARCARPRVPGPCTACSLRLALYSVIVPTTRGDGQTWGMGANAVAATSVYLDRIERVRSLMAEQGVDVLLLSVGHDLPYLTGYLAMPLERLTMLVLPQRRRRHARRPPPRGAARGRAARGVLAAPVERDRGPGGHRGRPGRAARHRGGRRPDVGPLPRRPAPAPAGDRVPARGRDRRSAARCARTPPRSPRSPPPARRPTASPRSCRAARSRCVGRTEAAGVDRPLAAAHRRGPRQGELRHRRRGGQRRQPAPPRRRRG